MKEHTTMGERDSREKEVQGLFNQHCWRIYRRTDRLFAGLLVFEWLACIFAALLITPQTWAGAHSQLHVHVWMAFLLGGVTVGLPVLCALAMPGHWVTRQAIAVAQMVISALLIHLTGGRIETHFHVFGSLAFLAFYRDWRVLATATLIVAADHWARGVYWPQSVFGIETASPWRWMEHAGWVLFEVFFLIISCRQSVREMRSIAEKQADLEMTNRAVEAKIARRTAALEASQQRLSESELQAREAADELRKYAAVVESNNLSLKQYADEAQAANRAKSEFLANMSHELRTPLNAVIGFSEGLINRVDKHPLNEHQLNRLGKIQSSGHHLLSLINDVLDLAKVESGNLEVSTDSFDVVPLVNDLEDLAEGLMKNKKDLVFEVELAPGLPEVVSDLGKIRQVLINLVGNAIKFTRRGRVLLQVSADEQFIRFAVKDTGVGIADEYLHRVFEKFMQIDQEQHESIKGTGLGLPLCKSLAEVLGGVITVASQVGQGSVFTLAVPYEFDAVAVNKRDQDIREIRQDCQMEAEPEYEAAKVLCIEDEPNSMQLLIDTVRDAGFHPIPAFDGEEGLRRAVQDQPDMITLDIMLPGLDGWEVLRRLSIGEDTKHIPVILTTAIDELSLGLDLGASKYLVKPIERAQLLSALRSLPEGSRRTMEKVAVIDDDESTRLILSEFLIDEDYQVVSFASGVEFIQAFDRVDVDAIVLDLMMPEIDGWQVAERLRDHPRLREVPIIVVTAKTMTPADRQNLHGHIRSIIQKNGLSRDKALGELADQLRSLKNELVAQ